MEKRVTFKESIESMDEHADTLYQQYLRQKTDYIQSTKELFMEYEASLRNTLIPLTEFGQIDLRENYSSGTKKIISNARRTGTLHLSNRGLTQVPEFVWTFGLPTTDGREAELLRNRRFVRRSFSKEFEKQLVHLDLSRNDIREFEPKAPLEFVRVLNLSHCKLTTLSEKLLLFRNLKVLLVGNNELVELPSCLGYLDYLEEIYADFNNLVNLPLSVSNAYSLKKLDISSNRFNCISPLLVAFKNLVELRASNNELLQVAPGIQLIGSLKVILLSNNKLVLLPQLCYMPNLETLDASGNQLLIFPNLTGCKALTKINLAYNNIQEVNLEFLRLVPVQVLSLSYNKLQNLPPTIDQLSHLTHLALHGNRIKRLPARLATITSLLELNVMGNPIENVDAAALKSTETIISYLKNDNLKLVEPKLSIRIPPIIDLQISPQDANKFPKISTSRSGSWRKISSITRRR